MTGSAVDSIAAGSAVGLRFKLTLQGQGEVLQTNEEHAPLTYVHGDGSLLPALEEALLGRQVDDRFEVALEAERAYGAVNEELFREVPADQVPEDAREVGSILSAPDYDGPIRVREVRDDIVVLDFNHPLAGEDLAFDITVVSVSAKSPQSDAE